MHETINVQIVSSEAKLMEEKSVYIVCYLTSMRYVYKLKLQ